MTTTDETNGRGSTVSRRSLGLALGALRGRAGQRGMSLETVADATGWSKAKISRMENGQVRIVWAEVAALCTVYDAGDETTQALIAAAKSMPARGWWHAYLKAIPPLFDVFLEMEAAASSLRNYENGLVPGLLQTRGYAQAVIGGPRLTPAEVLQRVDLRMERQRRLLTQPGTPRLEFVIDEAVLRRTIPNSAGMREQLQRLCEPGPMSIRVLPFGSGPTMASTAGGFVLLDFPPLRNLPQPPTTVYSELLTGALYLDEDKEVDAYELAWRELEQTALAPEDSRTLMNKIAEELHHATT